ncbi:hypothetical protein D1007_06081 [Hordeum vulgare]|nr:hypothetical protein D1007_06081 [Hordeum vulgare]
MRVPGTSSNHRGLGGMGGRQGGKDVDDFVRAAWYHEVGMRASRHGNVAIGDQLNEARRSWILTQVSPARSASLDLDSFLLIQAIRNLFDHSPATSSGPGHVYDVTPLATCPPISRGPAVPINLAIQIENFKTLVRERNPWKHGLDTFECLSPSGYPHQSTTFDCGIFAILYMENLTSKGLKPFNTDTNSLLNYRKYIAAKHFKHPRNTFN